MTRFAPLRRAAVGLLALSSLIGALSFATRAKAETPLDFWQTNPPQQQRQLSSTTRVALSAVVRRTARMGASHLRQLALAEAQRQGLPWRLVSGVIAVESRWQPHVRGLAGEYGLTQIKCASARMVGYAGSCATLFEPAINLRWGLAHLAVGWKKCGTVEGAATLHNRGPAAPCRTSQYAVHVNLRGEW